MEKEEKKTSVVFYTEWAQPLRSLPLEDVGELFCAILDYTETGAEPQFDSPAAAMAWAFIRQRLDDSLEKWDATRRKRQEAGRRGAIVTNSKERQTPAKAANAGFAETKAAKPAVYVHENVHENENENVNVNENGKTSSSSSSVSLTKERTTTTTPPEQIWKEYGYKEEAAAASTFAAYREAGMEDALLAEAVRQAAAHGAKTPLAYTCRVLEEAAAAGHLTLAAWQAAHRHGSAKRVDRASPSGNDFLADAVTRPRRHKRKG